MAKAISCLGMYRASSTASQYITISGSCRKNIHLVKLRSANKNEAMHPHVLSALPNHIVVPLRT